MSAHFDRAVRQLKKKLLTLSAQVEENVRLAVRSVEERNEDLAQQVFQNDPQVDHMEVDVEEECLKLLALYHPVAADLRFIVAVLKINNDLERIGDVAVNVAERAVVLANQMPKSVFVNFRKMGDNTQSMLKRSLDALVNWDASLARIVCDDDDEVDEINRRIYEDVQEAMRTHPEELTGLIHVLGVSRHLERIADLATNIAEDVIYMVSGEIVRHREEEFPQQIAETLH